jgi:hypothetical protein
MGDEEMQKREGELVRIVQDELLRLGDSSPVTLQYHDLDMGTSSNIEEEDLGGQGTSSLSQCCPSSTTLPVRARISESGKVCGSAIRHRNPDKQIRGPDASVSLLQSNVAGQGGTSLCTPEPWNQGVEAQASAIPEDTGDSSKTRQSQSSNLEGRESKNLSSRFIGRSEKAAKNSPPNDGDGNGEGNPFRGNKAARSENADDSKRFICYLCLRKLGGLKAFKNIRDLV